MARFRTIFTAIWNDEDEFLNYSDSEKVLFLYLISNSDCTESGIYKISPKIISTILNWDINKFNSTITKLYPNVEYDSKEKFVFVKNFLKYNGNKFGRPDLIEKSIAKDFQNHKSFLWHSFLKVYPNYLQTLNKVLPKFGQTLEKLSQNLNNTISDSDSDSESDSNNLNLNTNTPCSINDGYNLTKGTLKHPSDITDQKHIDVTEHKSTHGYMSANRNNIHLLPYWEKVKENYPDKFSSLSPDAEQAFVRAAIAHKPEIILSGIEELVSFIKSPDNASYNVPQLSNFLNDCKFLSKPWLKWKKVSESSPKKQIAEEKPKPKPLENFYPTREQMSQGLKPMEKGVYNT